MRSWKWTLKAMVNTVRKHIVWRGFVCTMAVIGGITTIASLQKEVIIPLFFSQKENRREVELVDMIKMFSPNPDGNGLDWTTGADKDSPIEWQSDERYGDVPDTGFGKNFSCARHGETTVLINGKPSHEQFDKCLHPAKWNISLYGCMATVECIQFESGGSGYNEVPEVLGPLLRYLKLREEHPQNAYTFVGRLYEVKMPNKREGWMVESRSTGNHSWSIELTLFPGPGSYQMAKACLDGLLEIN